MGTFLVLDISKVPSDSITQELLKSVFGIFGNLKLTRLHSNHMCRVGEFQVFFQAEIPMEEEYRGSTGLVV